VEALIVRSARNDEQIAWIVTVSAVGKSRAGATVESLAPAGDLSTATDAAQGRGRRAETTVDQALIRGLTTAFRAFVSGLSSV
jgi:hypothetical protein